MVPDRGRGGAEEGGERMVAPLTRARPGVVAGERDRPTLQATLATTPGTLRAASVVITLGLLVLAVVASSVVSSRSDATAEVGERALPELATAADLYVSLADADATSSTTFLSTGVEPRTAHQRFLFDLRRAGRALGDVTAMTGSSAAERRAATKIVLELPRFVGFTEEARANDRQQLPVGAAYQRRASSLMQNELLPAAAVLYRSAAHRLHAAYGAGTSTSEVVEVGVLGAVVLATLVGVQVFLARRTRRILNIGLVAATALVLVFVGWSLAAIARQQDSLVRAQREGSDGALVLSTARILTLQAEANEGLALIEQGTGAAYRERFDSTVVRLGGDDGRHGLLGDAAQLVPSEARDQVTTLQGEFAQMMAAHRAVVDLDERGEHADAVERSLAEELPALRALDEGLQRETASARRRFDGEFADASDPFDALEIAIPLLFFAGAALTLFGLQRRISEYR